jgi:hypothetical protein
VLRTRAGAAAPGGYGSRKIVATRAPRVRRTPEGTNEIMRVIVARGLTEPF